MLHPNDPQAVFIWNVEAPYLAISEDQLEQSVLSSVQFEHCFGSSKYRHCSETFSTDMRLSSCVVTLFVDFFFDALSVCDIFLVSLTTTEQATNLCFGIWLRTYASVDFAFRESHATSRSSVTESFAGCRI